LLSTLPKYRIMIFCPSAPLEIPPNPT
jgi:hypothetical protein